jgi:hypothetical protein
MVEDLEAEVVSGKYPGQLPLEKPLTERFDITRRRYHGRLRGDLLDGEHPCQRQT